MANLLPITNGKTTWRLLFASIMKTPGQFVGLMVLFALSSLAALLTPIMVGQLIDRVSAGQMGSYPWGALGVILIATFAYALLTRAWTYQGQKMGVRLNRDLGVDLVDSSLKLDAQTVEDAGSGDLVARLTDDVDSVRQVLADGLPEFIHISVYMVITSITIFLVNPVIGLVTVPMFLFMFCALRIFLPRIAAITRLKTEAISEMTVAATENIRGAGTITELGIANARNQVQNERIWAAFRISDRMVVARSIFWAVDAFNSLLPLVLSVIWGAYCVERNWASWGDVATASIMLFTMRVNSDIFTFWLDRLREMTVTMGRVFGVIDLSAQQQARRVTAGSGENIPATQVETSHHGHKESEQTAAYSVPDDPVVELTGVTYGYNPEVPVIRGVNLRLAAGQSLALVGRSGSGKTTLARLIAGSLAADSGVVRVGGQAVGQGLYPTEVDSTGRPTLLICTQEAHLFLGTLADNLTLVAPDASETQMLAALRAVGADWVDSLPEGVQTRLGGGHCQLSRDQVQQLALARIVLADPHVVILDESTTQLELADARQSLEAVRKGRAVVIISHDARIASLADRAVLLSGGQIVAEGRPEQIFTRA